VGTVGRSTKWQDDAYVRGFFLRQSLSEFGKIYSCLNLIVYPTVNKKRALFTSTLDLELRKKLVKCYIWSIAYMVLKLGRFGQ
jgi:hypothetical protein